MLIVRLQQIKEEKKFPNKRSTTRNEQPKKHADNLQSRAKMLKNSDEKRKKRQMERGGGGGGGSWLKHLKEQSSVQINAPYTNSKCEWIFMIGCRS